jgi:hypothetical protein
MPVLAEGRNFLAAFDFVKFIELRLALILSYKRPSCYCVAFKFISVMAIVDVIVAFSFQFCCSVASVAKCVSSRLFMR